jgi:hypothetical protein
VELGERIGKAAEERIHQIASDEKLRNRYFDKVTEEINKWD